ncbi:DtxR family transcriptional regulator [Lacrimispora amygdalina]|uniref:Manganese transport regulator n=1 Tax=Lacrimispora amygdalina TaxID=253257 RepID=A0A3E2N7R2_9FIRM|nr:iron dependent repressor, metal binding and dimerization domain protein [Clostridium indicum]RFZ76984.1 DtxR family transcriptional regulator [Clostridium indicum]
MNKPIENEFHTVRGYQLIKQSESRLTPALEDYLEMTYRLCLEEDYTRINKLSEKLNVRPPSASKMVSKLVELDFLKYNNLDNILLTTEGRITGAYLLERHNIIESFFTLVGSANALEETELVEHTLGSATVFRIKRLLEFFTQNPSVNQEFQSFMDLSAFPEF